ncbi:MAG TPA: hypothetical protein VHL31_14215 [Geminicoccus sp.]|jgi:hypothetical protein|uniref:hypothetical protein n=1 Tax=Geminicoccus sp. TaxID=2024832 RepID=UPI002E32D16B|nr:hypothetical protein [Geminicoccus sp.]HEX2527438.1 hypothetical protein [Geminicoccus sp.]
MTSWLPKACLREHPALQRLYLQLIVDERQHQADYVLAIMKTDAAELGQVRDGERWLRPGQRSPGGWSVYEAALQWCRERCWR